jgi:hypothetical protein
MGINIEFAMEKLLISKNINKIQLRIVHNPVIILINLPNLLLIYRKYSAKMQDLDKKVGAACNKP